MRQGEKPMGEVRINPKKNRIYIIPTGWTRESWTGIVRQIEEAALALKPNFTCLTDLRRITPPIPHYRDIFSRAQQILSEIGIGKSVRLLTEEQTYDPYFQHMDVVGARYGTQSVTTLKEAERILNAYKQEMDQVVKKTRRGASMFKILDPGGHDFPDRFIDLGTALKRVGQIRRQGHSRAVVVDAASNIANDAG